MAESDGCWSGWTKSLHNLPKVTYDDVVRIVNETSQVKTSKLRKGYKFFWEKYIFNYKGKCLNSVETFLLTELAARLNVSEYLCKSKPFL